LITELCETSFKYNFNWPGNNFIICSFARKKCCCLCSRSLLLFYFWFMGYSRLDCVY